MEAKKWWMSRTIWGAILAAIFGLLPVFGVGVEVDEKTQGVILDNLMLVIQAGGVLVGAVLAVFGRVSAKRRVKK